MSTTPVRESAVGNGAADVSDYVIAIDGSY
jgi:hypothetical protein